MLLRLLDVLDGDEALELAAAVDDQQLLDAVLVQQLLGGLRALVPSAMVMSFLVIIALHRLVEVALEADVAVGEDADRPPVGGHHRQARRSRGAASARAPAASFWSGPTVTGLTTTPVSAFLTLVHLQRLLGDGACSCG